MYEKGENRVRERENERRRVGGEGGGRAEPKKRREELETQSVQRKGSNGD